MQELKKKKLTFWMRPYTAPYSNLPLNVDQNVKHS